MSTAQQRFLAKERLCSRCKNPTKNTAHAWCKSCQAAYYQEKANAPGGKEFIAKRARDWRKKNREAHLRIARSANLKRQFGITIEQYDAMHETQHGLCKICQQPESTINFHGKPQRLAVDHCHKTKINRGLLCSKCNHALERIEGVSDWCSKAQAYLDALRDHPST